MVDFFHQILNFEFFRIARIDNPIVDMLSRARNADEEEMFTTSEDVGLKFYSFSHLHLMYTIEDLVASIGDPIEDIEELFELTEDAMGRWFMVAGFGGWFMAVSYDKADADEDNNMSVIARIFTRRIITTPPPQEELIPPKVKLGRCRIEDFEMGRVIGTGSFGRVYLAHKKGSRQVFATKSLSKACILNQRQLDHVKSEKELLQKLDFPFIVNLVGYSQDVTHVYLVMDYVCGGEFFSYLRKMKKFEEETARFYAAQVLLTFEHLHKMDIVYRDLKPENLLLDDKGNIKLADFGFAKKIDKRTYTVCGTPDYLAPEVIIGKGHGKAVDWWAFGVLIYEMLAGYAPFYDTDPMGTYQKILAGKLIFAPHFSRSAKDLIRKLLTADLSKRLGCLKGGADDIKNHSWFANVDWDNVLRRRESPPIRPKIVGPDDTSNFEDYSNLEPLKDEDLILTKEEQDLFRDL
ncbi:hypothetical protein L7F22_050350 [Adiantum nelumboides]|nr:hypothetical protein [Adiantum nelumboides]